MTMSLRRLSAIAILAIMPATSFALPIDWHGAFGVDTTLISGFRKIKSSTDRTSTNAGSQEVALDKGNKDSLNFLSYVFKLAPTMIINDAATFKSEFTTGYAAGGYLGDAAETDAASNSNRIPVHYHNQAAGKGLNVRKAYLELYSDTATYLIGRHTYNWGLGAVYNDGNEAFDRHSSSRDGLTMKLKIGNFHVHPYWSKTDNGFKTGNSSGLTSATDSKDYGIGLLYDNAERDISFGLLYGLKSSSAQNPSTTTIQGASSAYGETDVKITDIYFKKTWDKFDIAAEVPLLNGELGRTTNGSNTVTKLSTKAVLLQTNYKASDAWTVG
ncbi:MAG: hypothetical protein K2Q18_18680, partial [Bdellovibrionales bacterium]|nr:hypothetical protein [Bdellovibrionales bacterium]